MPPQAARRAGRFGIRLAEPRDRLGRGAGACPWRDRRDRADGLARPASARSAPPCCAARRASSRRTRSRWTAAALTARRIVIAAGCRAAVPPIPGLDQVPFLTNETLFDLAERPDHLLILGGGPIGLEMADAHAGLGCRVTVIEAARIAGKEDPELVDGLRDGADGAGR